MKNAIKVQVGNAVRDVVVEVLGDKYIKGYVGKAYYCWKMNEYDLPYVKIKGKVANEYTRGLVKLFLLKYREMLTQKAGKSPLHFNSYDGPAKKSKVTAKVDDRISGVPHWMREDHKEWVECFYRDGSGSYLRRTRFKEESRDLVEEYLPYCQQCPFRVDCEKPCKDPDLMSQSEAFQKKKEPLSLQDKIKEVVLSAMKDHKTTSFYLNKTIKQSKCDCGTVRHGKFDSCRYDSLEELLNAVNDIDSKQIEEYFAKHHNDAKVKIYGYQDSIILTIRIKEESAPCVLCSADDMDDVF